MIRYFCDCDLTMALNNVVKVILVPSVAIEVALALGELRGLGEVHIIYPLKQNKRSFGD